MPTAARWPCGEGPPLAAAGAQQLQRPPRRAVPQACPPAQPLPSAPTAAELQMKWQLPRRSALLWHPAPACQQWHTGTTAAGTAQGPAGVLLAGWPAPPCPASAPGRTATPALPAAQAAPCRGNRFQTACPAAPPMSPRSPARQLPGWQPPQRCLGPGWQGQLVAPAHGARLQSCPQSGEPPRGWTGTGAARAAACSVPAGSPPAGAARQPQPPAGQCGAPRLPHLHEGKGQIASNLSTSKTRR